MSNNETNFHPRAARKRHSRVNRSQPQRRQSPIVSSVTAAGAMLTVVRCSKYECEHVQVLAYVAASREPPHSGHRHAFAAAGETDH